MLRQPLPGATIFVWLVTGYAGQRTGFSDSKGFRAVAQHVQRLSYRLWTVPREIQVDTRAEEVRDENREDSGRALLTGHHRSGGIEHTRNSLSSPRQMNWIDDCSIDIGRWLNIVHVQVDMQIHQDHDSVRTQSMFP